MATRKMKIAVSGLTGAGKSTILNGLVGREVFKEGHDLVHETLKVTPYTWKDDDNNFEVTVCDTPGFEDSAKNGDQYLEDIKKQCSDADLLLYCISVQEARPMLKKDENTLSKLKTVFDSSIWGHCIIVLTFANAIVLRNQSKFRGKLTIKMKVANEYHKCIKDWKQAVQETIGRVALPNSEKIPILPAGDGLSYSILDNNDYWLSELYHIAIDVCEEDPQSILLMVNMHRLKGNTKLKKDHFDTELIHQPIVITDNSRKIIDRLGKLATAASVGSISGGIGATIGATVGALCIGLPTFGIAAGFGLAVGGVAGAGVGVGIGVGVYKLIAKIAETEHKLDPLVIMDIKGGLI